MYKGVIKGVSISEKRGTAKINIKECEITSLGLKGDAHAGEWEKQVSLLSVKSMNKIKIKGQNVVYGQLSENLTVEGIELHTLPIGTRLKINDQIILEITKIGKNKGEYNDEEYEFRWPMINEGVFAKVIKPGYVKVGDTIEVIS